MLLLFRPWRDFSSQLILPVVFIVFIIVPMHSISAADFRYSVDNQLYFGYNSHLAKLSTTDTLYKQVFEDWASVGLGYGDFELNMIYEAHLPKPVWSYQATGQGISERWLTYKKKDIKLTAGNFYTILGKGITYSSFRNRDLRYTSNIDGVQVQYNNRFLDLNLFGGRPDDFAGERLNVFKGGEVRISPVKWGFLGVTVANTVLPSGRESTWGSAYSQVQGEWGNVYAELASRDILSNDTDNQSNFLNGSGTAFYSASNFFLHDLSVLFEAAYYNQFDISEGVKMYNCPPPSIKEHTFTFMSRAIPTLNANNHVGLHTEFSYAFNDENNATLILSRERAKKNSEEGGITSVIRGLDFVNDSADYSDICLKGEFILPQNIDWTLGAGVQTSMEYRDINFVMNNDIGLKNNFTMQLAFEHQHSTVIYTDQKYFSQIYAVTLARSKSPRASIALITEYTTDQKLSKKIWPGIQINWSFYDDNEIVFFAGERKNGKSCAGGVCVYKPEFSGVEITYTSRL